jgi:hypothetical protein
VRASATLGQRVSSRPSLRRRVQAFSSPGTVAHESSRAGAAAGAIDRGGAVPTHQPRHPVDLARLGGLAPHPGMAHSSTSGRQRARNRSLDRAIIREQVDADYRREFVNHRIAPIAQGVIRCDLEQDGDDGFDDNQSALVTVVVGFLLAGIESCHNVEGAQHRTPYAGSGPDVGHLLEEDTQKA